MARFFQFRTVSCVMVSANIDNRAPPPECSRTGSRGRECVGEVFRRSSPLSAQVALSFVLKLVARVSKVRVLRKFVCDLRIAFARQFGVCPSRRRL